MSGFAYLLSLFSFCPFIQYQFGLCHIPLLIIKFIPFISKQAYDVVKKKYREISSLISIVT